MLMKVAVITRHAITNYGSLLQSIATQSLLEQLGHSCEIIDYIRADEEPRNIDRTVSYSKYSTSSAKRAVYVFIKRPETIREARRFREMRRVLHLTRRYSSLAELSAAPPEADVYMTGSDQVWGPVADGSLDEAYCLSFVTGKRKVAFSASIGMLGFAMENVLFFKEHLADYSAIAVREESAVDFLVENGIRAQVVLDPTLLLSGEEWAKMASTQQRENYLLIYQLHNNPKLYNYAREIARNLGLRVLRVSPTLHHVLKGGKFIYMPQPADFLSLFKNATFLMTDSFHGTAFALNFKIPFLEVLPTNGTSSRIVDILKMTGLSERIVGEDGIRNKVYEMDFSHASSVLQAKREESFRLLNKMLAF